MRRPKISDLIATLLFLAFVCGFALAIRKIDQEVNFAFEQIELPLKQLEKEVEELEKQQEKIHRILIQKLPVWKKIKLDTRNACDADTIRKTLKSNGFELERWANDILEKVPRICTVTKLDLVVISSAQLGFKDVATYQEIFRRTQELGFKPVPAEVAPQLRLQYPDQPENEWLHIGMKPIIASDGDPTVFDILHFDNHEHDDNSAHNPHSHSKQLCSSSVRYDVLWSPSSLWVFAKN